MEPVLPVTSLVDQFYADVEKMGGRRWDTSSLFARQEALQKGHLMDSRTAPGKSGVGAPITMAICAMRCSMPRAPSSKKKNCQSSACAPLRAAPVSVTRRHTGTFPITKRCSSNWRWKGLRNCARKSRRRGTSPDAEVRPHREDRRRLHALRRAQAGARAV